MSSESPLLPGEQLIDELQRLMDRLDKLAPVFSRTIGLREARGRDCPFYRKSLELFLRLDYMEVSSMIKSVNTLIGEIENGKEDKGRT